MMNLTIQFYEFWKTRLSKDYPQEQHSIATWLIAHPQNNSPDLSSSEIIQLLNYRYMALQKRYLYQSYKQGYKHLINRLSAIVLKHPTIEPKFNHTPQHQQFIVRLVQQVVEAMLKDDPNVQQLLGWVKECTSNSHLSNSHLREALTFASLEEYCCQPVNRQPLLLHRVRTLLLNSSVEKSLKALY